MKTMAKAAFVVLGLALVGCASEVEKEEDVDVQTHATEVDTQNGSGIPTNCTCGATGKAFCKSIYDGKWFYASQYNYYCGS